MDLPFLWVDVFADEPLTGNPLALVPDADALTEAQLRAIAREFNQSETTFLCRPTAAGADVRLRSFTPAGVEVGGAGHNAMGAWIWLAGSGRLDPARDRFVQQLGGDLLPVTVSRLADGRPVVTMEQSAPVFSPADVGCERLARALGLDPEGLAPSPRPEVGSTGAAHLLVRASGSAAVDAAAPDAAALKALLAEAGGEGCYLYAVGSDGEDADARFFNPTVGIAEDPATGTAAGPLAALLVRDGSAPAGDPVRIRQGRALGRPSLLTVTVDGERVALTGSGVLSASGALHL
ncbi:PhzF family phenazine biosynthesis protein [Leifsonia shinshuensis]|uniref:PhzF family phenazine biosynthesis protein n=1 Tax=Leifsonia shinshuensis TaxID=150026 RepID=A0A7G6YDT5_9MICO|nr:PhzF family phenazine biosynthesis protein [Leifsonia shinshuensis]QNE36650.1 PhzF family phenazine biosynthesis protein [Leifsonia shinshuensis]